MKTTVRISTLLLLAALLLWVAAPAQAAKAKAKAASGDDFEALEQYVADLRKNPGNEALRIKIINLVQDMKPSPAIPEEARRHYVTGKTYLGDAKKTEDFAAAVEELKKALLVAPWWPEAYLELARALKGADRYDEAASALKLFMETNPKSDLARKAQDEIYILEAKKGKAAQGFSPDTDFKAWLARLNGSKWIVAEDYKAKVWLELNGDMISQWIYYKTEDLAPIGKTITGTKEKMGADPLSVKLEKRTFVYRRPDTEITYEISEDGEVITSKTIKHPLGWSIGQVSTYRREK